MPTIKISEKTKEELNELMAEELEIRIKESKAQEKKGLFIEIIKNKLGITYEDFIKKLIKCYKNTK